MNRWLRLFTNTLLIAQLASDLTSAQASAHTSIQAINESPSQQFCKKLINQSSSSTSSASSSTPTGTQKISFLFRYLLNQKSIVKTREILTSLQSAKGNGPRLEPIEFTILISGVPDSATRAMAEFKKQIALYSEYSQDLRKSLKNAHSFEACLNQLTQKSKTGITYDQMIADLDSHSELLAFIENERTEKMILSHMRPTPFLQSKIDLDQIRRVFRQPPTPHLALFLHASEDGRLYDSNWNFIPRSLFWQMSTEIETLAIYSCHPEAVQIHYDLPKLARENSVKLIFPEMHPKTRWLLKDRVPAVFAGIFLKRIRVQKEFSRNASFVQRIIENQRSCWLSIDLSALQDGSLGVFIDQIYAGQISRLNSRVEIDCGEIRPKVITLQNLNLFRKIQFIDHATKIQGDLDGLRVEFENHYSPSGEYVGSKSTKSAD